MRRCLHTKDVIIDLGDVSSQRQSRFQRATRLLAMLTCSAALCFATLASLCSLRYARFARSLAPFTGSLTHFAHSLLIMCSRCKRIQWEQTRFWSSLETRPDLSCHSSFKQETIFITRFSFVFLIVVLIRTICSFAHFHI